MEGPHADHNRASSRDTMQSSRNDNVIQNSNSTLENNMQENESSYDNLAAQNNLDDYNNVNDYYTEFNYHNNLQWQLELDYQRTVSQNSVYNHNSDMMPAISTQSIYTLQPARMTGAVFMPAPSPLADLFADPSIETSEPTTDDHLPQSIVQNNNNIAFVPVHGSNNVDQPAVPMGRTQPTTTGETQPFSTSVTGPDASVPVNNTNTNNNTQSTDGAKMRKSCVRCHTRKMKCIILAGSTPKLCTECQKKEFVCEFEQKKPYIRKPTASSQ